MKKRISLLLITTLFVLTFTTACGFGEIKLNSSESEDGTFHIVVTPTTGASAGKEGITTSLSLCSNDLVKTTINAYYQKLISGDTTGIQEIVTAPVNIGEHTFAPYREAKEVKVKYIYTIEGQSPVDMVAYVCYELYFEGIETGLLSLDEIFLTVADDSVSIINGNIATSVYNAVVEKTSANTGVSELVSSVNRLFNDSLNKDAALKAKLSALAPTPTPLPEGEGEGQDEEKKDTN